MFARFRLSASMCLAIGALASGVAGFGCEPAKPIERPATAENTKPAAPAPSATVVGECLHPGAKPEGCADQGSPDQPANAEGHFGHAFSEGAATPVSVHIERLGSAAPDPDHAVKLTGTINSICQRKGCWMVLEDRGTKVRVMTYAGGFLLPMDKKGKRATVEGKLTMRELTEAQVKHVAFDAGQDPDKVSGSRREWFMQATAAEIH